MSNIIIYSWPGIEGLASLSPFSLKPMMAAKAKGLAFDVKYVRKVPAWVGTGKLPAALIDDKPIVDSTNIMKALDYLPSEKALLYPSDPILNAEVTILEDWADESLFWYMVAYRFQKPDNFARFSQIAFGRLAWPLRSLIPKIMRKTVFKRLKAQGLGCLSSEQLDSNFKALCQALDYKLLGRSYFVGSHLTAADIAIYAQLKQIIHNRLAPGFSIITEYSNLAAFIARMEQ